MELRIKIVGEQRDVSIQLTKSLEESTLEDLFQLLASVMEKPFDQSNSELQLMPKQEEQRPALVTHKLIYQGRILADRSQSLASYQIQAGHVLHLVLHQAGSRDANASIPGRDLQRYLNEMQPELRSTHPETCLVLLSTLQKICENIVTHPTEAKYRKLRLSNPAIQRKLFQHRLGRSMVQAMGFQEGVEEDHVVLVAHAEAWNELLEAKRILDNFLRQMQMQTTPTQTTTTQQEVTSIPSTAPIAGMMEGGERGGGGGVSPNVSLLLPRMQHPTVQQQREQPQQQQQSLFLSRNGVESFPDTSIEEQDIVNAMARSLMEP